MEKAFSSHYQSSFDEANRATWRKTRQQAEQLQQRKLTSQTALNSMDYLNNIGKSLNM